jgi:hypothetical protein
MKIRREIKSKEDFCPVCLVGIPLLFSGGIGTATAIQNSSGGDYNENLEFITEDELFDLQEKRKKRKTIIHWCFLVFILSVSIIIYFKFIKPCDECR